MLGAPANPRFNRTITVPSEVLVVSFPSSNNPPGGGNCPLLFAAPFDNANSNDIDNLHLEQDGDHLFWDLNNLTLSVFATQQWGNGNAVMDVNGNLQANSLNTTGLCNINTLNVVSIQQQNNGPTFSNVAFNDENGNNVFQVYTQQVGAIFKFLNVDSTVSSFTFENNDSSKPVNEVILVQTANVADRGITIRKTNNSQTGNLLEVQDSGHGLLSGIDSSGHHLMVVGSNAPTSTPADGALYLDTTHNKLYARCGGAWKSATLS